MYNTVPESIETLQLQVAYMEVGTNPIVFFPSGARFIPKLPSNSRSYKHEVGDFYYNSKFMNEKVIEESVNKGFLWLLLGFAQDKREALKGSPIAIVSRTPEGIEIKTAVIDGNNDRLCKTQAFMFYQFFPNSIVTAETGAGVIVERLYRSGELHG